MATAAMISSHWIVADMDSTLVNRPVSGLFPTLKQSPCFRPVLDWLEIGKLLVVTTADMRTFAQVWDVIPADLRRDRRVLLSLSEGACLIYGDENGEPVIDTAFEATAINGESTFIKDTECAKLRVIIQEILGALFKDMLADRSIIKLLTTKYHKPLEHFLNKIESNELTMEQALAWDHLTRGGSIMTRTDEIYVCLNRSVVPSGGGFETAGLCSISVMGMPRAISAKYFEHYDFDSMGIEVSSAPNSLWFKKKGVDKASPVRWLMNNPDYGFDIQRAVAFGDCPHSNDGPLSYFESQGMRFVSVAAEKSVIPLHLQPSHVGLLEEGTALVIEQLVKRFRALPASCTVEDWQHVVSSSIVACQARASEIPSNLSGTWIDGREV